MVSVRTFTAGDRSPLRAVFQEAGAGSPTASLWGHEDSEAAIYLDPYMDLTPDTLFLAFAGDRLVGYLSGCLDTAAFPSESDRIDKAITEHRLIAKRGPLRFFARATVDSVVAKVRRQQTAGDFTDPRWPAHLHINVVPAARGTGAADALMAAWDACLLGNGSPGCHLQTLVENARATRFFEKSGFVAHGHVLPVPGLRYQGHTMHQLTMVRPSPPEPASTRGP